MTAPRRLFALDQNYPQPIVIDQFLDCAELIAVRNVEPSWTTLDDHELITALQSVDKYLERIAQRDKTTLAELLRQYPRTPRATPTDNG